MVGREQHVVTASTESLVMATQTVRQGTAFPERVAAAAAGSPGSGCARRPVRGPGRRPERRRCPGRSRRPRCRPRRARGAQGLGTHRRCRRPVAPGRGPDVRPGRRLRRALHDRGRRDRGRPRRRGRALRVRPGGRARSGRRRRISSPGRRSPTPPWRGTSSVWPAATTAACWSTPGATSEARPTRTCSLLSRPSASGLPITRMIASRPKSTGRSDGSSIRERAASTVICGTTTRDSSSVPRGAGPVGAAGARSARRSAKAASWLILVRSSSFSAASRLMFRGASRRPTAPLLRPRPSRDDRAPKRGLRAIPVRSPGLARPRRPGRAATAAPGPRLRVDHRARPVESHEDSCRPLRTSQRSMTTTRVGRRL